MALLDLSSIKPNPAKAFMLAKRELSLFVYDAVQLQGIKFSRPEIQTRLEAVNCLTSK